MNNKIFIIEDDANILYGLAAQLGAIGFQVETESGGEKTEEIIKKIKIFTPDFVILDLILPRLDGFSLLEAIKSDKEINTSVFIFTNLSDEDSRARGSRLGADYYFIKNDFSIIEFTEKIKNIIKNLAKKGK